MKRLLCVLLAVALTFTLCACSEGQSVMDKFTDTVNSLVTMGMNQQTTTPATKHEVALKRGNEVGNVCYNAQLAVITAKGIQEETVDPTSFGKVTVINFWYTACGPCVAELPYFDAIAKKYGDQIAVVAVHGMFSQTAPAYIADRYPDSPIVFLSDYIPDGKEEINRNGYFTLLGGVYNIYPRTVVLDERGIITHVFPNSVTESELETAVLEAMGRM